MTSWKAKNATSRRRNSSVACTCEQRRILALERLRRTTAPVVGPRLRHRIRGDVRIAVLDSVKNGSRQGFWGAFRYVEASGHVRVHGAGQNGVDGHALSSQ